MRRISALCMLLAAPLFAACDSTDTSFDPVFVMDTVELTTPTSSLALPTALDLSLVGSGLNGGRYPEREEDAQQWDLALRLVGGELVFAPAAFLGVENRDFPGLSRAGLTEARTGSSLQSIRQAPRSGDFITDRTVTLRQGEVYVVRSRQVLCGVSVAEQFGKFRALEVDPAQQRVRLEVIANERCGDQRLVEES